MDEPCGITDDRILRMDELKSCTSDPYWDHRGLTATTNTCAERAIFMKQIVSLSPYIVPLFDRLGLVG